MNNSWLPMSSAPKDGTTILVFAYGTRKAYLCQWRPENNHYPPPFAWVVDEFEDNDGGDIVVSYPIAWRPVVQDFPSEFLCSEKSLALRGDEFRRHYQEKLTEITALLSAPPEASDD